MNQDFLFELGCEELPADQLKPMSDHLQASVGKALDAAKLQYSNIQTFYTPHRLALLIKGLQTETQAQIMERRGPAKNAPAQAIDGFLKSCNAKREDLIEIDTDKGVWLAVKISQPAVSAKVILKEAIENAIKTMPLKKSMRWGNRDFAFLRPVHWIVALLGEEIVPIKLFDFKAGRITYGHRFHHPGKVELKHSHDYVEALRKAYVMVGREERKTTVLEKIKSHPARLGKLEETLDLVEWPVPLLCSFEKEFLNVPQEVLISTMEANQRVFPVVDSDGKLQNKFWTVANIESKKPESVIHGNEKVVRARLSDAKFFYDEDLKVSLEQHLEGLKKITFQQGLGSLFDKTLRLEKLVEGHDAKRAAHLCKADLVTQMVQEFPELQGYMGHQYAMAQGIHPDVAMAIEDHYRPKGRGGELPRNETGATLALADKIDTLVGLFSIGKEPTSSGDPFALRRQALGVIAILVEKQIHLDLRAVFKKAYELYQKQDHKLQPLDNVLNKLEIFFRERMEVWFPEEKNIPVTVVSAVIHRQPFAEDKTGLDPFDVFERIQSLTKILKTEEGQALKELAKRVNNILDKDFEITREVEVLNPFEKTIYDIYIKEVPVWIHLPVQDQFVSFLKFRKPIADFFDNLMVNDPNEEIKNNRRNLLKNVRSALMFLADFSKL